MTCLRSRNFLAFVLLSFALVLGACSDGGDTPGSSPETTPLSVQIEAKTSSVVTGGSVQLTAVVDGDGAKNAKFTWAVVPDGGQFDATKGDSTTWTAPTTPESYTITVTATSGDESVQNSVQIKVNSQISLLPKSEADNNTVKTGTDAVLHAGVDNPANETVEIVWSAGDDAGQFDTTSGDSITWTAPTTPGSYMITVTATSGDQSQSATLTIDVQPPLSVTIDAPASVEVNTSAPLTVEVGGFYAADVTAADINWTITDGGALATTTGKNVSWTSPKTTGSTTISVSATDGEHTVNDTVTIDVTYENCTDPKPCTIITNVSDLQNIQDHLSGHYYLVKDIDASDTENWNGGKGFVPVGDDNSPFTGILDGQGHTIDNLYMFRKYRKGVGLFGVVDDNDTCIEDLGLADSEITGGVDGYVGSIVGRMYDGTIKNVYSTGTVDGGCYQGGILGWKEGGTLANAYNTGAITAGIMQGGIVGYMGGGTVRNVYNMGTVKGGSEQGGIAGRIWNGAIVNTYNAGTVEDGKHGGGIVGRGGGIVGRASGGTLTACYWDIDVSGVNVGAGVINYSSYTTFGITGKTTTDMQQKATYQGWDFTSIWQIDDGNDYPDLRAIPRP